MNTYADNIKESVRESLLVLDRDLRVSTANRSFNNSFHVTSEVTTGRLISELGNGQWDSPVLRKLLEDVVAGNGEFNDYQIERDFPGIGQRTMLLNARELQDGDQKDKQILLAIDDITDRRRAELEAARHQRTLFQLTLNCIGDAVIATDANACVTFLNACAETITGWSQKEAAGMPLEKVFHIINETTRNVVESPVAKALRDGSIVGLANHTLLLAKDGSEHPIDYSAAPIRDSAGKIVGLVLVFHDIGERRRAEHQVEASEIRYRRLFEAAHDGILILDAGSHRITDVNPFMLELLGYPREYFLGKELWEIGIFRDKEASLKAMEALRAEGAIRFEDLPLQDRNGHAHPVEIVANVYQEDCEAVIQCNIRDIGERVAFERERGALLANEHASRMEAEAANRSKDLFLATLSHEVRTPLNAILGWATILRGGNCSNADLKEGMEVIERNCNAQARLIEEVLDISRIVSGKLHLDIRACELADIINAAVDGVHMAAEAKGVQIETTHDRAASSVSCDANRMQQVVSNLLSNAVKFAPKGSTVRITLARERSTARIQVSDDGQGISPEFLPYVFDCFRQADSSTRRKLGGLGLGLSIVQHIVKEHGGFVRAESAGEGRGATFTVNLPIRAVQIELEGGFTGNVLGNVSAPDLAPARLDGLRVLVVDDEADARRLLLKVLGEAGAVVTPACSVAEALVVMTTANPQVLLSDIAMPVQDGYDLIRQLRREGHLAKDLPAVALTAFAHKDDRLRVLLAGFQVHVSKPVDPHELTAVIASLTGRTGEPVSVASYAGTSR